MDQNQNIIISIVLYTSCHYRMNKDPIPIFRKHSCFHVSVSFSTVPNTRFLLVYTSRSRTTRRCRKFAKKCMTYAACSNLPLRRKSVYFLSSIAFAKFSFPFVGFKCWKEQLHLYHASQFNVLVRCVPVSVFMRSRFFLA
jgi:hypothetical protein